MSSSTEALIEWLTEEVDKAVYYRNLSNYSPTVAKLAGVAAAWKHIRDVAVDLDNDQHCFRGVIEQLVPCAVSYKNAAMNSLARALMKGDCVDYYVGEVQGYEQVSARLTTTMMRANQR